MSYKKNIGLYLMFCPCCGLVTISIYSLFEDLFTCFVAFTGTTAVAPVIGDAAVNYLV